MCHKHIPKENTRGEKSSGFLVRMYSVLILRSHFLPTDCKPRSRIEPGTSTLDVPENLYRITTILRIRYRRIHLRLLCLSILKELNSNLWEQSIRQYVFILLDPLFAFFAECI